MISGELKVRQKFVGYFWQAIRKDAVGCQSPENETDNETVTVAETFDTVEN